MNRNGRIGTIDIRVLIAFSVFAVTTGCFRRNEMIEQESVDAGADGQTDGLTDELSPVDSECNADEYLKCLDGNINLFDSCGEPSLVQSCTKHQVCRDLEEGGAVCCALKTIQQCGGDGDVHAFDSCGFEGELIEDCHDLNGTCINSSDTTAECDCVGNWDLATGCTSCRNEWTDSDCNTCPINHDEDSDCSDCGIGFTSEDCGLCQIGYLGSFCSDCGVDYESEGEGCVFNPGCGADWSWLSGGEIPHPMHRGADFSTVDSDSEPTVLDTITNLEWRRCLVGESWSGETCEGIPVGEQNWSDLFDLCEDEYAGHSDWRIPELTELVSLIDYYSLGKPPIEVGVFPSLPIAASDDWGIATATLRTSNSEYWKYSMSQNNFITDDLAFVGVLCVRNSKPLAPPPERFQIGEDDGSTVIDAWSGLEWKRCPVGQTWSQQDNDCEGNPIYTSLNFASDKCDRYWHIPSLRELLTIVNYCASETTTYQGPFPSVRPLLHWTSTAYVDNFGEYWVVNLVTGELFRENSFGQLPIYCVK